MKKICPICKGIIEAETEVGLWKAEEMHMRIFHKNCIASGVCPECGGTVFAQEGCLLCQSCGWSKC
jgi:hypothetical protein